MSSPSSSSSRLKSLAMSETIGIKVMGGPVDGAGMGWTYGISVLLFLVSAGCRILEGLKF